MKWLEAFNTDGESTSLAQMNSGTTAVAGNFNPPVDSVIRKVAVFLGGEVATSLVEDVRIELESSDWTPNRLHFLASGNGIRTAPATHIPVYEFDCALVMRTALGIRGDYIHEGGTPVTSRIRVMFGFD